MSRPVKNSTYFDIISKLNAEVFTQKAGRLYPPVIQLLALEKRLALCTAALIKSNDNADQKHIERMFWDNVNHAYRTGYFADEPQWTSNIFIPMHLWENLLYPYVQFFKTYNPNFNFFDFAFITATLGSWRYSQPVLKLEDDVYKILLNDKDGAYVDGFLLNYFFQWTTFIQTPGLHYLDNSLYGFFAHQNEIVFQGMNTKILIIVFSYVDDEVQINEKDTLYNTKNWNDFVVLRYEINSIKSVKDSLISSNITVNEKLIELVGKMLSLFNFSIHPKTDIYNHRGYLMQPSYNDTIDSFLNSYRKQKSMPIRRGVGKHQSSHKRKEVLYHVHAPSCPRLFETGSNTGFVSRMHKISPLANKTFEETHWKNTDTGLKLATSRLYSEATEVKLLKSLNAYFYGDKA